MAESIDIGEDTRTAEVDDARAGGAVADVAEAVTPPRRFYANLADL